MPIDTMFCKALIKRKIRGLFYTIFELTAQLLNLHIHQTTQHFHMKYSFPKPALLLLLTAAFFSSCSKNDDDGMSNTEKLTLSVWRYDKASVDTDKNGTPDTDVPPGYLDACDLDNTLSFEDDGTGVVDEGATKCNSSDPQTNPFTWNFSADEKTINFPAAVFTGISGDVTVKTLTETKLELVKEVSIPPLPGTYNIILSLKH